MEDSSLCGISKSEGKNSEAISDTITSPGDHNSTDNVSSTGWPSGNQQNNEVDKTDDTIDVQKIPVDGHPIKEEEEEDKDEDEDEDEEDCISEGESLVRMGYAKSEPEEEIRKELERKSSDDEERREDDDDNELPRKEAITASMADLKLVSSLKGSRKNEDKPRKAVTWSQNLEEFAPSEDEIETSHYPGKGAGKSKQKGAGKSAGESGSKSNGRGGRKGAGKNKKKGKKHGGSSSKWSNYSE